MLNWVAENYVTMTQISVVLGAAVMVAGLIMLSLAVTSWWPHDVEPRKRRAARVILAGVAIAVLGVLWPLVGLALAAWLVWAVKQALEWLIETAFPKAGPEDF